MADSHAARYLVRLPLAVAACGVTLAWSAATLVPHEAWQDPHGYNQLIAMILTSGLHCVVGLPLVAAWWAGVVEPWLPLAVFAAPVAHFVGSMIDWPTCELFFLVPSAAVLSAGLVEARYGRLFGRIPAPPTGL